MLLTYLICKLTFAPQKYTREQCNGGIQLGKSIYCIKCYQPNQTVKKNYQTLPDHLTPLYLSSKAMLAIKYLTFLI